ncbi:hypothetical protein FN976_13575 [Caenimonas sedimenti]|uniref:Uncharacterized protein n=1 Tax=Caenimonas sedimenti TaxID=2596921 RepID=A0A562ZQK3_9BURK|nr:hypothetical protein [Caenimonas sedimenti]TWO70588.1 hypothetical protein FN976_13575 [Caenimonas sedimenti]
MDWLIVLVALATFLGFALAWRLARLRVERAATARRKAARDLVDSMKAYGAWMDARRDEPLDDSSLDELTVPPPLRRAVTIKDEAFPQMAPAMVRLLKSHSAMIEFLWQQNILRIGHAAPGVPIHADPRYQSLRDNQDAAIDSIIAQSRQLIGEDQPVWHGTRSDFIYSSGLSLPSHPFSRR